MILMKFTIHSAEMTGQNQNGQNTILNDISFGIWKKIYQKNELVNHSKHLKKKKNQV
jgi:hypothetical protein